MRVLIAEDEYCSRLNLIRQVKECIPFAPEEILEAENGKEAWDYLSSIKDEPDLYEKVKLIITDIEMPQMDGHRLTKLIKDDSRLKKIPVIIFSSLIDDQMRRKGKELGADDQLAKPEIGRLVAMMDKLLKEYEETRAKARG